MTAIRNGLEHHNNGATEEVSSGAGTQMCMLLRTSDAGGSTTRVPWFPRLVEEGVLTKKQVALQKSGRK